MNAGNGFADCLQDVAIVEARQASRQAALDADLGSAPASSLTRLVGDLFQREKVRLGMVGAAAEGTEFAADETNVGEIDVASDDVSNDLAC